MMLSSPDVFFRYVHTDAVQLGFVYPELRLQFFRFLWPALYDPSKSVCTFRSDCIERAVRSAISPRLTEPTILANRPVGSSRMLHDVQPTSEGFGESSAFLLALAGLATPFLDVHTSFLDIAFIHLLR